MQAPLVKVTWKVMLVQGIYLAVIGLLWIFLTQTIVAPTFASFTAQSQSDFLASNPKPAEPTHNSDQSGWGMGFCDSLSHYPLYYATHAVSPLLALAKKEVESVVCHGSGTIRKEYIEKYNSPFAIETAHLKLRDSDLTCEVKRSLFDTIRQYRESFDVYGTKLSFEWEQIVGEGSVIYSGYEDAKRIEVLDYGHLLPKEIAPYTIRGVYDDEHLPSLSASFT